jgi:UDP:flavonoid glycosyltransferase YjiC (YdhE family)
MHITILALGSHGDVLPFAVLGKGLSGAGHQVRLVTFQNFQAMVETRGLDFYPVQGDAQALMGSDAGVSLAGSGGNLLAGFRAIMDSFGSLTDEYIRVFSDPRLWDTDLVINQLPAFGYEFCEKAGVPWFSAGVIPLIRTNAFPIPLFPQWRLGGAYNAISYHLAEQLAWQPFRKAINHWRRDALGLKMRSFWGNFSQILDENPCLAGFSSQVVACPPDWGEQVHVTGYWFSEPDPAWVPPDDLIRFLDSGPPPIFIGFGSMPFQEPGKVTATIERAFGRMGQRGILSGGWGDLGEQALGSSILKIGYVPYTWLLPCCAGSVIHGGSGSTASALRAGVPTLVVPFLMDQFYWGKRVFDLGLGPRPVPIKRLTTEAICAAIEEILHNDDMRRKAAVLGDKLRAEDGVSKAISVIQQYT